MINVFAYKKSHLQQIIVTSVIFYFSKRLENKCFRTDVKLYVASKIASIATIRVAIDILSKQHTLIIIKDIMDTANLIRSINKISTFRVESCPLLFIIKQINNISIKANVRQSY